MWKICLNAQLGEIENAIDLVEQAINDRFGLVVSFTKEKLSTNHT